VTDRPDDADTEPADTQRRLTRQERFDIVERSAIEAELETGRRETTIAEAKRSLLVRIVAGAAGFFLIVAGVIMLVVPGPGLLAIALGLGLIAPDVPFAARLLERLRKRLPQDEDGGLPTHVIVMMVTTFVVATGASIWWTFLR
jgi:cation:H+ antiporter